MNPEPKVTLISWTQFPLETVWMLWWASKNEKTLAEIQGDKPTNAQLEELFKAVIAQHIPIGESINFVFMIEHVSVSWREQAVRHRIGVVPSPERLGVDIGMLDVHKIPDLASSSWWSQSMRIQDMTGFAERGEYRMPASVLEAGAEAYELFKGTMESIGIAYKRLLKMGVPMEDARELMPLGAQHRISWALNINSLQHIVGKRGCVVGDTKIPLLDGRTRTMKELYEEYGTKEQFWVYSCDDNGNLQPGLARSNGVTQQNAELVEVELDNGEVIRATPDHKFMRRDGGYAEALSLVPGESLMPLYRRLSSQPDDQLDGYEQSYVPAIDDWEYTHRWAAASHRPADHEKNTVHHTDFNKPNNAPSNLNWLSFQEHIALHAKLTGSLSSEEQSRRAKMASPEVRRRAGLVAAEKGVLVANLAKAAAANRGNKKRGAKISAALKAMLSTPEARKQRSEAAKKQWALPAMREKMGHPGVNHKVVAVRRIEIREDVYDLSVDKYHNYATDAGVFIHNCWILQLGIWGPVIMGMISELVTKVHPIFSELVCPPCMCNDTFTGCEFMEENRRRMISADCHAPCSLYVAHHALPPRVGLPGPITPCHDDGIPMFEAMAVRAKQYELFWGRDPFTGKRTGS